MKKATFKKIRRLFALVLLIPVVIGLYYVYNKTRVAEIYAVDPLVVTYAGGPPPNPVFNETNMLPGDEIEKTFTVKNDSPHGENVIMTGVMTAETKQFADILEIIVGVVSGPDLYGGTTGFRTLQDFLNLPFFDLGSFPAGVSKSYRVKVKFPTSAGNEYQLAKVVFDIRWDTKQGEIELPPECARLQGIITKIVQGTENNDHIHGSVANELILAKGGNDHVEASSGSDCIVLGEGNDHVESESGDDIILGGGGNDKIESGFGNDTVYGGSGNDNIDSGSGNDLVYGDEGNDNIDLGDGDDTAYGGGGNDTIRGGSGKDKMYGEANNDNIKGGSENDYLDGGPNTDVLMGNDGTDTCLNGETATSCEL